MVLELHMWDGTLCNPNPSQPFSVGWECFETKVECILFLTQKVIEK